MIKKCNFCYVVWDNILEKEQQGCILKKTDVTCNGEENCILYQIYKMLYEYDGELPC